MRVSVFAVMAALFLAGCAEDKRVEPEVQQKDALHEVIESAVKAKLKDPYSAKIKITGEYMRRGEKLVCGTVNAKNAFGGYVGERVFLAWIDGGGASPRIHIPVSDEDNRITSGFCADWDGKR